MNKLKIIILSFCISHAFSCNNPPPGVEVRHRIAIKNNSPKTIYIHRSFLYPDTTIPDEYYKDGSGNGNLASGSTAYFGSNKPWRQVIEELPADTISIIIFDPDTISHYGWEKVRNEHNVLKRWDIGVDYLENRDWTLVYPE